ncbi:sperm acrosome-associated protein 9 isoform X3 [Tupaia chinensis]|uniref:sperm acrosome-associated protein 9 isoform X3 n=1 Tax=Tupaia chinensis TaxID=246437 RepID=UPI0007044BFC|nr:sperm acrosome-associated protein 9 isoform X3 [Tupaia chinensis]
MLVWGSERTSILPETPPLVAAHGDHERGERVPSQHRAEVQAVPAAAVHVHRCAGALQGERPRQDPAHCQHWTGGTPGGGWQVQSYTEHYCNNSTDRRVLLLFLDICAELNKLCLRFETLHSGTPVTNSLLEKCKALVSQSNDLSSLRAKYPHDVVNHLSCDEARNHYGGVVSLIPIVLDLMKEWIAHSEKLPRKVLQHVSEPQGTT